MINSVQNIKNNYIFEGNGKHQKQAETGREVERTEVHRVRFAFTWFFAWGAPPFLEIRIGKTQIENHSLAGLRSQMMEFGAVKMAEKWKGYHTKQGDREGSPKPTNKLCPNSG